jgi:phytanoyl-CoA hydroxylase
MDTAAPETLKTMRRTLSQDQINDYMADGYLRYGQILDEKQIDLLRREYDQELEKAGKGSYLDNLAAGNDEAERDGLQFLEVAGASMRNIWFRRLVHLDKLLDVVEDLIGPNIRLLEANLLYKPPYHGSHVFWHQDNLYQQCFPANMVTAWLTLDDVGDDNGAMAMIPGSHLRPIWETLATDEQIRKVDITNARVLDLPAGGITFHHCQALHRSSPNKSPRPRRAVVMRFIPAGTQSPRMQTTEWSFFVHPILRMKS